MWKHLFLSQNLNKTHSYLTFPYSQMGIGSLSHYITITDLHFRSLILLLGLNRTWKLPVVIGTSCQNSPFYHWVPLQKLFPTHLGKTWSFLLSLILWVLSLLSPLFPDIFPPIIYLDIKYLSLDFLYLLLLNHKQHAWKTNVSSSLELPAVCCWNSLRKTCIQCQLLDHLFYIRQWLFHFRHSSASLISVVSSSIIPPLSSASCEICSAFPQL